MIWPNIYHLRAKIMLLFNKGSIQIPEQRSFYLDHINKTKNAKMNPLLFSRFIPTTNKKTKTNK